MAKTTTSQNAVFVALNRRFFDCATIFLRSLFKVYPNCPDILVFHTDLTPRERGFMEKYPSVKTVQISSADFETGPPMATHRPKLADPVISYARFLIWTDHMKDYETVLHLDTDLLILKPFEELFAKKQFTIFEETYQAEDALFYDARHPELLRLLQEDSIQPPRVVANCGVFTVPKKDRTPENRELLTYLLKRYSKFIKWADQSVINLWMAKKGIMVNPNNQHNFQHRLIVKSSDAKGLSGAKIFHFNGVDLTYRVFLMRCASVLAGHSAGWKLYRLIFNASDLILRLWRKLNKPFIS